MKRALALIWQWCRACAGSTSRLYYWTGTPLAWSPGRRRHVCADFPGCGAFCVDLAAAFRRGCACGGRGGHRSGLFRRRDDLARPGYPGGLTTAAGIWTAGASGLAIGLGLWLLGITGTVLALFLLASEGLFRIDRRIEAAREDASERGKARTARGSEI